MEENLKLKGNNMYGCGEGDDVLGIRRHVESMHPIRVGVGHRLGLKTKGRQQTECALRHNKYPNTTTMKKRNQAKENVNGIKMGTGGTLCRSQTTMMESEPRSAVTIHFLSKDTISARKQKQKYGVINLLPLQMCM